MEAMRSAVILAGGNSHRLGLEKALLEFDSRPLICWTIKMLLSVADEVVVVARDRDHAGRLEEILSLQPISEEEISSQTRVRFTWDSVKGFGPVAGLEAGLRMAKERFAFVTGCDIPFLNHMVIERLFELADPGKGYQAAVPVQPNGYFEPLQAVYERTKMQQACQRALKRDERRIHVILQELVVNQVPEVILKTLDPELLCFFNINTREDLEKAQALWPHQREKALAFPSVASI